MKYRFCEMNGRLIADGTYDNGCCHAMNVNGPTFRLLVIVGEDELTKEMDATLDAQCESMKLAVMAEGKPEGEAKEATMKRLDLWASLTKDSALKGTLQRLLTDAHSECEEVLYALQYKGIRDHMSIDNVSHDKLEWVMELQLPRHMSENSAWAIMRSVQEYMKCKCIATWSQNKLNDEAKEYAARAEQQLAMLKNITRHRNLGSVERRYGLL